MDCSLPGSAIHGIFQARVLEWGAIAAHQLLLMDRELHQLLTQPHVHRVSDTMQPSHPLSSPSPLAFNLFQNQSLFQESGLCIKWPKYWSFSFNISSSNGYSGLISFRMDWLDLLAVQGTLKSLFQQHTSKAPILWHSGFFIVQVSHPYMTTRKKHSFD